MKLGSVVTLLLIVSTIEATTIGFTARVLVDTLLMKPILETTWGRGQTLCDEESAYIFSVEHGRICLG